VAIGLKQRERNIVDLYPLNSNGRCCKDVELFAGLFIPALLLIAWLLSLLGVCAIDLTTCSPWLILGALALRTFLQTGLFITAHDAMHGSVSQHRQINDSIGRLCTTLYALLPYEILNHKHHLHHRYPASELDPDFSEHGMLIWYLKFMGGYISRSQFLAILLGMATIFVTAYQVWQVSPLNLLLLWVLPIWFSSMQLFYFGTYLPHRLLVTDQFIDHHQARSSNLSIPWSLLSCYHFGYHWEHHEYPQVPWYRLPSQKKM
jgi:beta-carotene/zeaxanthin 4-ketolase